MEWHELLDKNPFSVVFFCGEWVQKPIFFAGLQLMDRSMKAGD